MEAVTFLKKNSVTQTVLVGTQTEIVTPIKANSIQQPCQTANRQRLRQLDKTNKQKTETGRQIDAQTETVTFITVNILKQTQQIGTQRP